MERMFPCLLMVIGLTLNVKATADDLVLRIEVRAVPKGAKPVVTKMPIHYKLFEKRIKKVEGKSVLELMDTRLSIQLLNNTPGTRLSGRKKPYTGADFVCAILRGKIVSNAKMRYDLQGAEECLVTTPKGEFRVGIYYAPVAYVVLPNGESYWFFFDEKSK